MASPIRWDNVNAPDFSSSGRMLEASGQQMGNAIASLKSILNTTNQVEQANWENQRTNTTNGALAKIMSFADPKALADAQNSGLYQQLIGDGSVPIDHKAVMAALDSRGQVLQNRAVAGINYENAMTDKAQEGNRQQALMHLLNGDMSGFKQAVAGVRDPASLVTAGLSQQHYADKQKQEEALFNLKKELIASQITVNGARAADLEEPNNRGSGGKGGSGTGKDIASISEEEAQAELARKDAINRNPYYASFDRDKSIEFAQKKVQDKRMNTFLSAGLSRLDPQGLEIEKGLRVEYPQWLVEQGMVEMADSPPWGPLISRSPDLLREKINEIAQRPGVKEKIVDAYKLREEETNSQFKQQELARKAKMRLLGDSPASAATTGTASAQSDNLAMFMNNGRVRDFATGGYRDVAPVDPRTAPAANQTPVVPVQAGPAGLTYNQLMGGTNPKKGMSANPPTSTPLISKEDKPSASVGLSLGTSGSITGVHPDAIKIPEVNWTEPKVIQQAAPGAIPKGGGERAVVTFVEDGDTAKLLRGDGSQIKCRIDKIDAPETAHEFVGKPGQAYGNEARKTLQDMIDNKEVALKITRPADKGNRFGCQIEVEGTNVDLAMVQAGAAWLYRRYANDPNLVKAEQEARTAKRGLWADPNPVSPETFRRSLEKAREGR